jgi:hypothetical protein
LVMLCLQQRRLSGSKMGMRPGLPCRQGMNDPPTALVGFEEASDGLFYRVTMLQRSGLFLRKERRRGSGADSIHYIECKNNDDCQHRQQRHCRLNHFAVIAELFPVNPSPPSTIVAPVRLIPGYDSDSLLHEPTRV